MLKWGVQFINTSTGPGVDSASSRNEYQKYFPGVMVTDA